MKLRKKRNIQSVERPHSTYWFDFINDDRVKSVVPIGPRFQVDVPSWTLPCSKNAQSFGDRDPDKSKWTGIQIWPLKGRIQQTNNNNMVGRGRSEICDCAAPGSVECVRRHIWDKKCQLKIDLGPAYWRWKFDDMGEDVSKLWSLEEQKKFEYVVKMNSSFMKSALECLPCQSKQSIVSYYLNVYIPRRIGAQTRSGCVIVDTDEESEETPRLEVSRKRFQSNSISSSSSKYLKSTCLTARQRRK